MIILKDENVLTLKILLPHFDNVTLLTISSVIINSSIT